MKPVATIGSMHVCPMVSGYIPHVGGPVIGPGAPNVLANGKPIAVMGDKCSCVGPPDTIVMGNPSILVNGKPIACMGDMTSHGGTITMGEPNILVGRASPIASSGVSVKEIPMPKVLLPNREAPTPKITALNKAVAIVSGNGKQLREAQQNQAQVKEEAKKHGYLPDIAFSV